MPSILRQLEAALRRHRVVRLSIDGHDLPGSDPFGVPVVVAKDLVTVQLLRDFRRDGYAAVPVAKVASLGRGAFERAYTRASSHAGVLQHVRAPARAATDLLELLMALRRSGVFALVVFRSEGDDRATQILGRVVGVNETTFTLRPFDALGRWQPRVTCPLADVLEVQWASRYLRVWHGYLNR